MRTRRQGFTLVELLVVMGVIGLLVALLLPAVLASRETARRTECGNNLKSLATAALGYEQRQRQFPGYRHVLAKSSDGLLEPSSWVFPLLPELERRDIYEAHGPAAADEYRGTPPNVYLRFLTCASDGAAAGQATTAERDALSYVANTGLPDVAPSAAIPGDWRENGVFQNSFPQDAGRNTVAVLKATASFINQGDGAANTLLLSENLNSGNWGDVEERQVGFVWEPSIAGGTAARTWLQAINVGGDAGFAFVEQVARTAALASVQGCASCGPPRRPPPPMSPRPMNEYALARPSSWHSGGVNVAYVDGRVDFLSEDVDYLVYCLLMTPKGKDAAWPGAGSGGKTPVDRLFRTTALPAER